MKCLDKKRIKMKQGETLALNERIMLSLVSTGVRVLWIYDSIDCYLFVCSGGRLSIYCLHGVCISYNR